MLPMSFHCRISFVLLFLLQQCAVLCIAGTRERDIQYRFTVPQFNKVTKFMIIPKSHNENAQHGQITGSINRHVTYTMSRLYIDYVVPDSIDAFFPRDHSIHANIKLSGMHMDGFINITGVGGGAFGGVLGVDMFGVVVTLTGEYEYSPDALSPEFHNGGIILGSAECHMEVADMSSTVTSDILAVFPKLSSTDLYDVFKKTVCDTYRLKYSIAFGVPTLESSIQVFTIGLNMQAIQIEVQDSTVLVNQRVNPIFENETFPRHLTYSDGFNFPSIRTNAKPFEIWLKSDVFNELWSSYTKNAGLGEKRLLIKELIPTFRYTDVDVKKLFPFPNLIRTFPNSIINCVLAAADVHLNITGPVIKLQLNLTGEVIATLNCDRNRTYTAFKFRMVASVPSQIGYDNHALFLKYLGYNGTFTILESNIGHIENRRMSAFFNIAPRLYKKSFFKLNKYTIEVQISQLIPSGLHLKDISLSVAKDHVILGGELTRRNPHLPKSNVSWVGDHESLSDLMLTLLDRTPETISPMPKQNCKSPSTLPSVQPNTDRNIKGSQQTVSENYTRTTKNTHLIPAIGTAANLDQDTRSDASDIETTTNSDIATLSELAATTNGNRVTVSDYTLTLSNEANDNLELHLRQKVMPTPYMPSPSCGPELYTSVIQTLLIVIFVLCKTRFIT